MIESLTCLPGSGQPGELGIFPPFAINQSCGGLLDFPAATPALQKSVLRQLTAMRWRWLCAWQIRILAVSWASPKVLRLLPLRTAGAALFLVGPPGLAPLQAGGGPLLGTPSTWMGKLPAPRQKNSSGPRQGCVFFRTQHTTTQHHNDELLVNKNAPLDITEFRWIWQSRDADCSLSIGIVSWRLGLECAVCQVQTIRTGGIFWKIRSWFIYINVRC